MSGRVGTVVAAVVLVFLAYMWVTWPGQNRSWYESSYAGANSGVAEHGQFGDSFGSLNALFTGLAFFGAVTALLLQYKALKLQVEQFTEAQRNQRLVDEMNVLQAALERVDDKLAQTTGVIDQPASAAQQWQLGQRRVWMEQRRTLEDRLATIGATLGWQLPRTTPPAVG